MKNSIFVIIFLATFNFCAQGIEVEYREHGSKNPAHVFTIKNMDFKMTPYSVWSTILDTYHHNTYKIENPDEAKSYLKTVWAALKAKCGARRSTKINLIEARVYVKDFNKDEAYALVMKTLKAVEQAGYHNKLAEHISDTDQPQNTAILVRIFTGNVMYSDDETRTVAEGSVIKFIGHHDPKKCFNREKNSVDFFYYPRTDFMAEGFLPCPGCMPLKTPASPLQIIKALLLRKNPTIDPKPKNEIKK